ncbi:CobW family GTP-binding protein [Brevibacillus sp. TJ4]|uniref:CobW family GTP-binding protein n=1 Tax=Brevibacillus sp. TJ4 TaxID=3234853 RepID=UPI003BA27C81
MPTRVYILTGYLGSGKTTLLQKMLAHMQEHDGQVVVLMNEMGAEDIDGELLQGFGFPVKKMLDGCICCSLQGELTEGLKEILNSLSPDTILIETTGVADPIDVVDGLTHPELFDRLELKGMISVVDASRFLELNSRFQSTGALVKTIRNQVSYADLLLLNKTDLTPPETLKKVEEKLQQLNPRAPLYHTVQSEVDIQLLLSVTRIAQTDDAQRAAKVPVQTSIGRFDKLKQSLGLKTSPSLYNSIESFALYFTGPVDPEKFEDFLYSLPKNVYRAKGYVQFQGKEELISFQHTDNQVLFFPFENFGPRMVAVFIGEGMDQEKIRRDLEACYAQTKESTLSQ